MPALGLLILGAQVLCVIHVVRPGRPYWWIFLIVMVPLVGILVYLIVEVLPGVLGSRGTRQAVAGCARRGGNCRYRRAPKTRLRSRMNCSSPANPSHRQLSIARR